MYTYTGVLDWQNDATLIRGGDESLGAPISKIFEVRGDDGRVLVCRAFANGIIAMAGIDDCDVCKNWAVVEWNATAEVRE